MLEDRREAFYQAQCGGMASAYAASDPLASRLMIDLLLTCDVIAQQVNRTFASFGISRSTFNVLMLLRHGPPEGMQLHDIGELLLVSRANITGLIDHLEGKGYVTREVPAKDRRVRHARLTAKAEALLDDVAPIHLENTKYLLSDLSVHDKTNLVHRLKQMRDSVRRHADQMIGRDSKAEPLLVETEG